MARPSFQSVMNIEITPKKTDGVERLLQITVPVETVRDAEENAARRYASQVRLPGFRPGKAPRRVLEARIGPEVGRSQALQDAIPEFYADAVKEHEVDVIAAPELELTGGEESGPVAFEAVVEVRPVVQVPGYGSLRVTLDSIEPDEEQVAEQIQRLRTQFGAYYTLYENFQIVLGDPTVPAINSIVNPSGKVKVCSPILNSAADAALIPSASNEAKKDFIGLMRQCQNLPNGARSL